MNKLTYCNGALSLTWKSFVYDKKLICEKLYKTNNVTEKLFASIRSALVNINIANIENLMRNITYCDEVYLRGLGFLKSLFWKLIDAQPLRPSGI